jgi:predicted PurR-regulated permease PerM
MLAILAALWWCQVVLIPVVLSVLISYACEPVVARLERWRLPRGVAVAVVMMSVVGGVGATGYLLRGEATAFVVRLPAVAHRIALAIQGNSETGPGAIGKIQAAAKELESATVARRPPLTDGVTSVHVEEPTFKWTEWMWSGSRNLGELVAQMTAVLCLTYYLLAAGDAFRRKLVRVVPTLADKKMTVQILDDIDGQIERFLLARAAISLIVAAVVWLSFRMLRMDSAGVWAVLSGLLFAIPLVGPTVFIAAVAVGAFVQFGTVSMVSTLTLLCIVIAAVEGNVLTPWLMSVAGEMSAVAVFVSVLFWGWIWGLWGVLLAVPITAAVKAICERTPEWQPMAEFLKK